MSRCCALYDESVALGYEARLIVNTTERLPEMQRKALSVNWLDLPVLMTLLRSSDRNIVDSYLADSPIYEAIASNSYVALYIDDYMRIDYPKGIVVNPSLYGDKIPYPSKSEQQCLGGSKYVITRPEFQNIPHISRGQDRNRILITMGGSDILNLTPIILKSIEKELPCAQKHVVIGPFFSCISEIKSAADKNTILHSNLSASQMRDLMLNVDIAVTAAGQTIYELMSCGVPMIPIKVADNQKWNVLGLQERQIMCIDDINVYFRTCSFFWSNLIEKSPSYEPFTFCGQKEILKILTGP